MKVIVYHGLYGCETGCCGHWVELENGGRIFSFSHASNKDKEDLMQYAKDVILQEFGEEHIKDLDWENCQIKDYNCGF